MYNPYGNMQNGYFSATDLGHVAASREGMHYNIIDSPEDISKCMNCTLEDCVNCLGAGGRNAKRRHGPKTKKPHVVALYKENWDIAGIYATIRKAAEDLHYTTMQVASVIARGKGTPGTAITLDYYFVRANTVQLTELKEINKKYKRKKVSYAEYTDTIRRLFPYSEEMESHRHAVGRTGS